MSMRRLFCSISVREVMPGQPRRPICSRARLSARSLASNMPISNSDSIVAILATEPMFGSSLAAQTGHAI